MGKGYIISFKEAKIRNSYNNIVLLKWANMLDVGALRKTTDSVVSRGRVTGSGCTSGITISVV